MLRQQAGKCRHRGVEGRQSRRLLNAICCHLDERLREDLRVEVSVEARAPPPNDADHVRAAILIRFATGWSRAFTPFGHDDKVPGRPADERGPIVSAFRLSNIRST